MFIHNTLVARHDSHSAFNYGILRKPARLCLRGVLFAFWALALLLVPFANPQRAQAQSAGFAQALAQALTQAGASDADIAAFYKSRGYRPIWTGNRDRQRRRALIEALRRAPLHGLPAGRYDAAMVRKILNTRRNDTARATAEVATTRRFLQYARDIQTGIVEPRRVDRAMTLRPPRRNRLQLLQSFASASPAAFLRALPPQSPDYQRLLQEKARMEKIAARGGWGPIVAAKALKPGARGPAVATLRKRLTAMGYGRLGATPTYDKGLMAPVAAFQRDHGLRPDGIAGAATLKALNTPARDRLMQTVIGLERLRWLNKPLGKRHIIVNEAAFSVQVIDNGKVTYQSRVVVGKPGRWRTPEFEDRMTHMVINPSWYVPASIAGGEYLPLLKQNPNALTRQDMVMTNAAGQPVNPASVDFSQYTKGNFPFNLRQRPSGGNALGKVKFLFPNKHAIYLHDTPAKGLFGYAIRAFSHGCVRVQKPDELAYTLLSAQSSTPRKLFDGLVAGGKETRVNLKTPVPIYLVYRTAWVGADKRPQYRADSYRVDRKLFAALQKAGVVLGARAS